MIKVTTIKGVDVYWDMDIQLNFVDETPFRNLKEAKEYILENY